MGSSNYDFWLDLLIDMENAEDYAELETFNLVATLHGAQEDVEFVVPADALVDLYFMGEAIINMIGAEGLMSTEGTPVVANNLTQN